MIYLSKNFNFEYYICNISESQIVIPYDFNKANIAYKAFFNDKTIQAVSIPGGVEQIEQQAFENCENLNFITFCKLEGNKGFSSSKLYGVSVDSLNTKVLKLQARCFSNCSKLHTVILNGYGEIIIENYSFANCSSLRTVLIPSDKSEIHPDAFVGCSENLTFLIKSTNENAKSFARENGFRYVEL